MNLWENNEYRVYNEDGQGIVTYRELLHSGIVESIRSAIDLIDHVALFLGRTILVYQKKYLAQNPTKAKMFKELEMVQKRNPLRFFAPSGPGALAFINDVSCKVCFITAGNRSGKTATAIVKKILGSYPCPKDWEIFTEHGVDWRTSRVHNIGIGSYEWGNHKKTIGPELFKWLPMEACPDHIRKIRGGRGKPVNWKDNPIIPLTNGSEFHHYAYNQEQFPFESEALQGWLWDEQPTPEKWEGANERIRSNRYAQHDHVLTPHRVPGNPFTGSGTFLHRLYKNLDTKGYRYNQISRNKINLVSIDYEGDGFPMGDVPEWVYPEESKKEAWMQHIRGPLLRGDMKAYRRGRSRIYGEWEESEGLVYEDFQSDFHIISPFPVPLDAALFRAVDHGRRNPCAGVWGFVPKPGSVYKPFPDRTIVWPKEPVLILFREYYEANKTIGENARGIIDASGNTLEDIGEKVTMNATYRRKRELFTSERYVWSKMDPKSFKNPVPDMDIDIGAMYQIHGLNLQPAPNLIKEKSIDIVTDWLKPDMDRPHAITGEPGFVKLMVFSSMTKWKEEMEGYKNVETPSKRGMTVNLQEKPQSKDDHLMDATAFMVTATPHWLESRPFSNRERILDFGAPGGKKRRKADPITGYRRLA